MGNCLKKKKLEDTNTDAARPQNGVLVSTSMKRRNSKNPPTKKCPRAKKHSPTIARDRPSSGATKKDEVLHAYRLACFSYDVLKAATNKFSKKNYIGQGGFGEVYKGWIHFCTMTPAKPTDGQAVAVKRLRDKGPQGQDAWQNEVKFLSKLSHPNLIKLIGYCCDGEHRILVYEYMPKGSLDAHLSKERDTELTWRRRMRIAIGAARGLYHLHTASSPVIHRDLKASNVLLDADFNPKLSDFGLAKFGPQGEESHVSTRVLGTKGYFAPEYIGTGHLTVRTDVYSFGVVLLQILSGSAAVDKFSNGLVGNLADHAKPYLCSKRKLYNVIDKRLGRNFSMEEAHGFAEIIRRCLNSDANSRPTMTQVLSSLEHLEENRGNSVHTQESSPT